MRIQCIYCNTAHIKERKLSLNGVRLLENRHLNHTAMDSYFSNCSNLTRQQRMIIGLSSAACASLSLLACCLVISLMIIFKKYNFTLQRLLLYLTTIVMTDDANRIIIGAGYKLIFTNECFCITTAFIAQYIYTCQILATASFVFELFLMLVLNKQLGRLEWLYVPVIFLTPALTTWIPIVFHAYGPSVAICEISKLNYTSCDEELVATVLYFSLSRAPSVASLVIGGLGYIAIHVCFIRKKASYMALTGTDRNPLHESIENITYLCYVPPFFACINLLPMAADIIYNLNTHRQDLFALKLTESIIQAMQGGLLSIFLTLDPRTRKRLTWHQIKVACCETVCKTDSFLEYPILEGFTDSLQ